MRQGANNKGLAESARSRDLFLGFTFVAEYQRPYRTAIRMPPFLQVHWNRSRVIIYVLKIVYIGFSTNLAPNDAGTINGAIVGFQLHRKIPQILRKLFSDSLFGLAGETRTPISLKIRS
jgi:hypothetical protein